MAQNAPFATSFNNDANIPVRPRTFVEGYGKAAFGVIYNTYSKPATPITHGMKPAAGASVHRERPYAQDKDRSAFADHPTFCALPSNLRKSREPDSKVGDGGFTSKPYSDQAMASKVNVDVGRYKGYVGGGKILYHD
eukprot:CAMPEP_0198209432 /NCGR_PEP_ID=MMETSP1445-20131203/15807_1 /TAXON_ID=36898 /ORGANISM="Pyramimonas sp., Strain CCMP2087" /LENGTH=136 /DNA_ID=CAMNT_0043883203 /DNA_START=194 /DNA_END=604 /DNA_ORIENTATION=-